ncbi:trigger factor [Marinihelvus fidelis]|uniref:Trigger factor n=1 Tax=Marinihelvus fidelis TaxID=2613842 RepID=A0A5N0TEJ2_9GAMM|nr:trigger factor [Marinihelvus fidelis]KAA9133048.1 trigger factor [Marinihelvus fidelis]
MQVTVENPGGLQRRLTVQVPAGEVQQQIDARLREIGKTAKLKGFRPGRVPMKVLQQRFGPSVRNEVVSKTVESSLMQAIQQESLKPAANPVIDSMPEVKAGKDFEFTATIEVMPEVDTVDASSIKIQSMDAEITEGDIDDMLNTLCEQRAKWEEVSREPKDGDQVLIEYAAETKDGRVPEEGMAKLAIAMGQSGFDKLEAELAKLTAGGVAEAKLKFPDDFRQPALAGKKADVSLKIDSVREKHMPEIDAEFIQSFGIESGDMDEMRVEVRKNLERELKSARLTLLKTQILNALLEAHDDLEVPAGLVQQEAAQLLQAQARQRGIEPDPALLPQFSEVAGKRVKSGLLISEIARQNDIVVDGAKVREAIESVASTYEQSREVVQMYYNNPELLRSVESSVLEEQVVDWVLEHAKVDAEATSFKELINAAAKSRQGL